MVTYERMLRTRGNVFTFNKNGDYLKQKNVNTHNPF